MAELEAREAAAQARAEALRARIAELTEQLTAEEELLSRLGITRETILELVGGDGHGWGSLEAAEVGLGGVEQDGDGDGDGAVGAALRIDSPVARAGLAKTPSVVGVGSTRAVQALLRHPAISVPRQCRPHRRRRSRSARAARPAPGRA